MTIATYAGLVSAVTEWLARDNDTTMTARIPDFITLAEAKMNRLLRTRILEERSTAPIAGSSEPEFVALPDDFVVMRRIRISSVTGKPKLEFLPGAAMDEYRYSIQDVAGQPKFFTIYGNEIELCPTPDGDYTIEMVYRTLIPGLTSSNTTNEILALAPDLYLYGTLLEATPYIQNDERIPVWFAAFQSAIDGVNKLSRDSSYGTTPMQIRTSSQVF